jgi:hypothetical protein
LDDNFRIHFVNTLKEKDRTVHTIQQFEACIQQSSKHPVKVFCTDDELSCGRDSYDWAESLGITIETFTASAPEQKGSAECSGGCWPQNHVPFGLNPSSFDSSGQKPCEQLGT